MLGGGYIHLDVSIKGGFAQEFKPFPIEVRTVEQFSIGGTGIDQEYPSGALPIQLWLWGI
jgi:hypothetical protein